MGGKYKSLSEDDELKKRLPERENGTETGEKNCLFGTENKLRKESPSMSTLKLQ